MGIPVTQPTYIFGDNQSVLVNSGTPHSQLKKKANSVAYHHVREGSALDEWRVAYVNTHENASDMMSKPLPAGEKRKKFCDMVLYFLDSIVETTESAGVNAELASLMSFPTEWISGIEDAMAYFNL